MARHQSQKEVDAQRIRDGRNSMADELNKAKDEWSRRLQQGQYSPRSSPRKARPPQPVHVDQDHDEESPLASLPTKRLKALAMSRGVDISGCAEKTDVVRALDALGVVDDLPPEDSSPLPPAPSDYRPSRGSPTSAADAPPMPPESRFRPHSNSDSSSPQSSGRKSASPTSSAPFYGFGGSAYDESPPRGGGGGDDGEKAEKKLPSYMRGTKASASRETMRIGRRFEQEEYKRQEARSQNHRANRTNSFAHSGPTTEERAAAAAAAARERFEARAAAAQAKHDEASAVRDRASRAAAREQARRTSTQRSSTEPLEDPPNGVHEESGREGDDDDDDTQQRRSSRGGSPPRSTSSTAFPPRRRSQWGPASATSTSADQRSQSPRPHMRRSRSYAESGAAPGSTSSSSGGSGGGSGTWSKPSHWQQRAAKAQPSKAPKASSSSTSDAGAANSGGAGESENEGGAENRSTRDDSPGSARGGSSTRSGSHRRSSSQPPQNGPRTRAGAGAGAGRPTRGRTASPRPPKPPGRQRSTTPSSSSATRPTNSSQSDDLADAGGGGADGPRTAREFTCESRMPLKCSKVAIEYARVWTLLGFARDRDLRSSRLARRVMDESEFGSDGSSSARYRKLMRLVHPDSLVSLKGGEPTTALTLVMAASLLRTYNAASEILSRASDTSAADSRANALAPPPCLSGTGGDYPKSPPSARRRNAVLAHFLFKGAALLLASPTHQAATQQQRGNGHGKHKAGSEDRLASSVKALQEIAEGHRAGLFADMLNEDKKRAELEKAAAKAAAKRAELDAKATKQKEAADAAATAAAAAAAASSATTTTPPSNSSSSSPPVEAAVTTSSPLYADSPEDLDAVSGSAI